MLNSFNIPYIIDGEITACDGVQDSGTFITVYTVFVKFPDGSETFLRNVPAASMFGGIGNYSHARLRESFRDKEDWFEDTYSAEERKSAPGDRVLISFISADIKKPIIIGFLPHQARHLEDENKSMDLPDPLIDEAQLTVKYQGIETEIDTVGQMTITHRGAPAISWDGSDIPEEIEATGPAELPERSASEGEAILVNDPTIPEKSQALITDGFEDPFGNPQLVYPKAEYTTRQGFLERGEWYVCDSEGQQVFLDRDSKTITITNGNDTIQIDKENKSIFVQSSGNIETHSNVDSVNQVDNNEYSTIKKDSIKSVQGNEWKTIGGNKTENVTGNFVGKNTGTWALNCEGTSFSVTMKSGNSVYLDDTKGKEGIFLIHNNGSQVSISSKGNIMMLAKDGTNISISGESGNVIMQTSKGALVSITDKILFSDATGSQMISITDSNVEINAKKEIILSCDSVNINSGSVNFGAQASLSSTIWEPLSAWLDMHTHLDATGTTLPPTIPTASLKGTPADPGSKYLKINTG